MLWSCVVSSKPKTDFFFARSGRFNARHPELLQTSEEDSPLSGRGHSATMFRRAAILTSLLLPSDAVFGRSGSDSRDLGVDGALHTTLDCIALAGTLMTTVCDVDIDVTSVYGIFLPNVECSIPQCRTADRILRSTLLTHDVCVTSEVAASPSTLCLSKEASDVRTAQPKTTTHPTATSRVQSPSFDFTLLCESRPFIPRRSHRRRAGRRLPVALRRSLSRRLTTSPQSRIA